MEQRTIRVTGERKVRARPDTIELKHDMTDVCKGYAEALEESARRTQALRECMAAAGLNGTEKQRSRCPCGHRLFMGVRGMKKKISGHPCRAQ